MYYNLGSGCDNCSEVPNSNYNNIVQNQGNSVAQTNQLLASIGATGQQPSIATQGRAQQNASQIAQQPIVKHYQPPEKVAVLAMNKKMTGGTTMDGPNLSLNIPSSMFLLMLGLVILTALSVNECCKYYINKTIQLEDGNPLYFVGYAGLVLLLAVAVYFYCQKNCNK